MKIFKVLFYLLTLMFALLGLIITFSYLVSLSDCPNSTCAKAKANLLAHEVAIRSFEKDMGRFPTFQEGLSVLVFSNESQKLGNTYNKHGYLEKLVKDPWGNDYQYATTDNGKTAIIWSSADESCYGVSLGREIKSASEKY